MVLCRLAADEPLHPDCFIKEVLRVQTRRQRGSRRLRRRERKRRGKHAPAKTGSNFVRLLFLLPQLCRTAHNSVFAGRLSERDTRYEMKLQVALFNTSTSSNSAECKPIVWRHFREAAVRQICGHTVPRLVIFSPCVLSFTIEPQSCIFS